MATAPSWPVCRPGYISYQNIGALQCLLNHCNNAGLSITQIYDDATRAAVIAYQQSNSLVVDGIAGQNTFTKLITGLLVQNGSSGYAALAAQLLLSKFEGINYTGSFDSNSAVVAMTFQQKMGITVDGIIGPTSWRYLLGYYFYPIKGCDTATELTDARLQTLVNNGYTFVCRYLPGSTCPMTLAEKNRIVAAGLSIISIFEKNPTSISYFSSAQGYSDAQDAINAAVAMGQPANTPIYFAVDYDASETDIAGAITDYLVAVYQTFANQQNTSYYMGLYGSGLLLEQFRPYISFTWLSCSVAWRGSTAYSRFCMKQYTPFYIGTGAGSLEIDRDDANTYAGFWQ